MDFEQKIMSVLNEKLNDGTVEKIIEEKLKKGISEALDNVFGYRGEAKKVIESKIQEVMVPVIEKHNFNQYMVKLDSILTEIVNSTNLADNKRILDNFQSLLKEPEYKEIKLSKFFEQYCEHVAKNVDTSNLEACCEDGEPYYEHVTASMEVEHEDKGWFKSSFDNCTVKFTCEEDEDLNCQIKLYKESKESTWRILRGDYVIDINSLKNVSDFEIFLSVLKRGFVEIILDTESEENDDIEPEEKPEWSLN
jgi:hypothetical protein|nr:MAG TPA: hypothetical protein [Caudoviricetes sp.]